MKFMIKDGFSVVEIAIFMAIVGILISSGISIMVAMYQNTREKKNSEIISSIHGSLVSISVRGRCLPFDLNSYPYLPEAVVYPSKDFYGKNVLYIPAPELVFVADSSRNRIPWCLEDSGIRINPCMCKDNIPVNNLCSRSKTSLKVLLCKSESCDVFETINNISYLVVSGGANRNIQAGVYNEDTDGDGIVDTIILKVPLRGAVVDFFGDDLYFPESFDDEVKFLTLEKLQADVGCSNTSSRITILTDSLPPFYIDRPYSVDIYPDGGVPKVAFGKNQYFWRVLSLPEWLEVDHDGEWSEKLTLKTKANYGAGGSILPGTVTVEIEVQDMEGNKSRKKYSLLVLPPN